MYCGRGFLTTEGQWATVLVVVSLVQAILLQTNFVLSDSILVTLVGSFAACLTTGSFIPQIVKAYQTKRMKDVSPYLMTLFALGTTLWLIYGVFKGDWVLIGANAFSTAFNLVLLQMKRAYNGRPSSPS